MYDPHRRTRACIEAVLPLEFAASDVVDEVIRSAVCRSDFHHVQPPIQSKLLDGVGTSALDRNLRFERRIELHARRRGRGFRYRLQGRLFSSRRRSGRFARGRRFGRKLAVPGRLSCEWERNSEQQCGDQNAHKRPWFTRIIRVSRYTSKQDACPALRSLILLKG